MPFTSCDKYGELMSCAWIHNSSRALFDNAESGNIIIALPARYVFGSKWMTAELRLEARFCTVHPRVGGLSLSPAHTRVELVMACIQAKPVNGRKHACAWQVSALISKLGRDVCLFQRPRALSLVEWILASGATQPWHILPSHPLPPETRAL